MTPTTPTTPIDAATAGLDLELRVPGRLECALRAPSGSVVAVIGPNGAGKSTLVRALAGLEDATGHAVLDGTELLGRSAVDRRVGVVFSDLLLFPHLSARDNVAFGPRSRGARRRTASRVAQEWLERLAVGDLGDRRPGELSGGQAQRVAIARALATQPALLLLDEPFSGLDVGVAAALRVELTRHLADFGGVTLLVTHDPLDALTLADTVLVLDEGRVAQTGRPAEVAARPLTAHVARLVGLNVVRVGDQLRAFRPSAVVVSARAPEGSAQHRWPAVVTHLAPHGDVVRVTARHDGPPTHDLIADVTTQSTADLRLAPGSEVWLAVKATAIETYAAPPQVDSIRS